MERFPVSDAKGCTNGVAAIDDRSILLPAGSLAV